jgi:hypothetical protein
LVAIGRLRYAALKVANRLAQVFKTHAVSFWRRADQFAAQGGDLAPFGFMRVAQDEVVRGVDPWWHCRDATLLASREP